jgi:hypothetical protein
MVGSAPSIKRRSTTLKSPPKAACCNRLPKDASEDSKSAPLPNNNKAAFSGLAATAARKAFP